MVLIKTTLSVVLAVIFIAKIEAYKNGPPVYEHPDICGSMSPKKGHDVEPLFRPVPFALTTLSASGDCYRQDKPLTVKLTTTDNKTTFFEGFLIQARLARSLVGNSTLQMDGVVLDGTFDTNGDSELQTLKCGNSTYENALGHSMAKHYFEKTFKWTPSRTFVDTIQFVATVVHHKDQYWMRVTSPSLRYDKDCVISSASSATYQKILPSALALILAIAATLF